MRENLIVAYPFCAHYGCPNLAQTYSMPPTGSDKGEVCWKPLLIGFSCLDYESRAVEMTLREATANLEFLADCHGAFCACDSQADDTAGGATLQSFKRFYAAEVNTCATLYQVG